MTGERDEPVWLSRFLVEIIHGNLLLAHGGSPGLRDEGLLEAAPARPQNRWSYQPDSDLAELAAAYAHALARDHPFVDGNKRVALMAAYTFLGLNGYELDVPEPEITAIVQDLSTGRLTEPELAGWFRHHTNRTADD